MSEKLDEARKALHCLFMGADELVARDVRAKVEAAFAEYEERLKPTMPLQCMECARRDGPPHPVDEDHPGWLCDDCYVKVSAFIARVSGSHSFMPDGKRLAELEGIELNVSRLELDAATIGSHVEDDGDAVIQLRYTKGTADRDAILSALIDLCGGPNA